jgi:hypothetical protein
MDWAPIWLDPSWQAEAIAWVDEQLLALGRPRTGEADQPHVRPWSTVMTIPTATGTVWFKAAGPGTAYEARLLRELASWATPMLLPPLAVEPKRGWLLFPDGGIRLRDRLQGSADLGEWERILPAYASLQRELAPRADALIALGVPDLRPAVMPAHFARLIDAPSTGLGDSDRARLHDLLPVYTEWCSHLAASGIAPSLQHDDLHDGNVFVGPMVATDPADGGDRIFDWGDAVVAHPFGTLLATLRSIASRDSTVGRRELLRLRDAYLEPWTAEQPRAALEETVSTALRVGAVGRAFAWERALSGVPPPAHGDYAGAVGEWLLELFEQAII